MCGPGVGAMPSTYSGFDLSCRRCKPNRSHCTVLTVRLIHLQVGIRPQRSSNHAEVQEALGLGRQEDHGKGVFARQLRGHP